MSSIPLLKFCGLTTAEAVDAAVKLGADAIGFVLCASPRKVELEQLKALLPRIPRGVLRVAVMASPETELIELANGVPFDAVQCEVTGGNFPELRAGRFLVPAFRDAVDVLELVRAFQARMRSRCIDRVSKSPFEGTLLLDGPTGGGKGLAPDAGRARELARSFALILAGGLTPANVAQRAQAVGPLAVDVSSGIESAPGHKDSELMARFAASLRTLGQVSHELSPCSVSESGPGSGPESGPASTHTNEAIQ